MKRREVITLLGGITFALFPLPLGAQQKPLSIGFLGAGAADTSTPLVEAVKQGLRENGLVEGRDYVFEPRWAEGRYERFPAYARELTEQGARVIIVTTISAGRRAGRSALVSPATLAHNNYP